MRPSSQDTQPAVTPPPSGGVFSSLLEGTATPRNDAEDPLIGRMLGEYVVRRRLGVGGMGLVYEGEQPLIHRRVAIKVLKPELVQQPELLRPLLAEARAVSAVHHPGIIDIFGFGDLPGVGQYIVMEFLDGEPLDLAITRRAPFPAADVIHVLDQVLAALGAAHAAGVIHRDMKPSNVFLARDSAGSTYVKLLDFGLAKQADVPHGLARQTRQSIMVGTPEYMSPEQAMGQTVGPMSDLYAVGVIAFEMLTGRLPFEGPNALAIANSHVNDAPPRASSRTHVPAPLDDLVLQLLAKNPSERPQSAALVRERLKRMLPHPGLRPAPALQLPMAREPSVGEPPATSGLQPTVRVRGSLEQLKPTAYLPTAELHARAFKRDWKLAAALGLGAVALGVAAVAWTLSGETSDDAPPAAAVAAKATGAGRAEGNAVPGEPQQPGRDTGSAAGAMAVAPAVARPAPPRTDVDHGSKRPSGMAAANPRDALPQGSTAGAGVAPPAGVVAGPGASRDAPTTGARESQRPVREGTAPSLAATPEPQQAARERAAVALAVAAPVYVRDADAGGSGGSPREAQRTARDPAEAAVAAAAPGLGAVPGAPTQPGSVWADGSARAVAGTGAARTGTSAAPAGPGRVRLLVKGWGQLSVDGQLLGQFPAPQRFPLNAVELSAGVHSLELVNAPAQKTWRTQVRVEPGSTSEVNVTW
jgi:serine/threonine protein kinase